MTSLQQYFENHYATTACACAGEKHNTLQMCNDWPNVVVETEDNGSLQSQSRGKRRSTIKDNANTNTTHDEQMSLESQSIEASQPLVTKDCPKSTTKQTKTSQSQPIHSPFHHSRATKPSLIKKRKENRVINANTNQSKENAQKRPQVLDVTSNHPPAKSPRCSKDFGSRRKTYSISPDTKKKSHDKLKTTIMEELEQRLQQKCELISINMLQFKCSEAAHYTGELVRDHWEALIHTVRAKKRTECHSISISCHHPLNLATPSRW